MLTLLSTDTTPETLQCNIIYATREFTCDFCYMRELYSTHEVPTVGSVDIRTLETDHINPQALITML